MRTNRTFAANCGATLASAHSNFGGAYHTKKICGFTRHGLVGVALATTYDIPPWLTLDVTANLALKALLRTTETSICRSGTDQYSRSSDAVSSSGVRQKPWRS